MSSSITIAILAGGHSKRMGSDKSFVMLHGRPLIQHVIDRVAVLAVPIILIANDLTRYQTLGLPVFSDTLADKGSLGGIYTALCSSQTEAVLCVACDMPFLNPALLYYLMTLFQGFDAVVPQIADRPQGLHAIYHKTCLPTMRDALEQDRLKVGDYLRQRHVHYVGEYDLRRHDPELKSFTNVNTSEDLQYAETIL